jgi:hypothetical protein
VSPVRYEQAFYIPEDGILHSQLINSFAIVMSVISLARIEGPWASYVAHTTAHSIGTQPSRDFRARHCPSGVRRDLMHRSHAINCGHRMQRYIPMMATGTTAALCSGC